MLTKAHIKAVNSCLFAVSLALVLSQIRASLALNPMVEQKISMRMPDIRPDHGEQYLCMARRVHKGAREADKYIVGFNPKSDSNRVHHMLVYGCEFPGIYQPDSPNFVWDCGSMHSAAGPASETSFERGPVCRGESHVIYGWALDAPALKLPPGVGFKVGDPESAIKFLVLQLHYGHHQAFDRLPDLTDNSGLELELKSGDISKRAGVLLMSSVGQVEPGHDKHEIWCTIEDDIELHPFRYRLHTHKLGTKVMGAKIGRSSAEELEEENGSASARGLRVDRAEIIGAGDPQMPQTFYPVRANITIGRGDNVYASCEFNNNRSRVVQIGDTAEDEMCNFYLMYWTDSLKLLQDDHCVGFNPASYRHQKEWSMDKDLVL